MSEASRRDFLALTGAGVAAIGVGAAVSAPAEAASASAAPRHAEPLVAHVSDPSGAELRIHSGDSTIVVHDRELVVRLLRASAKRG